MKVYLMQTFKPENMRNSRNPGFLRSVALFFIWCIIVPVLFFGCSSGKTMENNTILRDSVHLSKKQDTENKYLSKWSNIFAHDSIYRKDSVVVQIKGDTVYMDRWHLLTKTNKAYIYKTDTIVGDTYRLATDSVVNTKYVTKWRTKKVEKQMSLLTRLRLIIGDCFLLFLALVLLQAIIVKWKNRKKK